MTVRDSKSKRESSSRFPAAFAVTTLLFLSSPARASDDCLLDYANCVDLASDRSSFWQRSGAGLRCYLDLLSCFQRRLA
jgi:hypothetical protein